jgi:hypothetical protein
MLLEVLLVWTIIVRMLLLMVKGGSLHSFLWLLLLILVVLMLPFIESSKDFPQSLKENWFYLSWICCDFLYIFEVVYAFISIEYDLDSRYDPTLSAIVLLECLIHIDLLDQLLTAPLDGGTAALG